MTFSYLRREEDKDAAKAFKRLKKKVTIENLWIYILRLLQNREMYGYELKEKIKERFGFAPAIVTSYTILYKLERDNLVKSEVQSNPQSRPDRKYYRITEEGRELMKDAKGLFEEIIEKVFDATEFDD